MRPQALYEYPAQVHGEWVMVTRYEYVDPAAEPITIETKSLAGTVVNDDNDTRDLVEVIEEIAKYGKEKKEE